MCCPRGREGRWRRCRPRPLSGRGRRGRQLLIVRVSSRVSPESVGPVCGGPRWAKLRDWIPSLAGNSPARRPGLRCGPLASRGGGPSLSAAPSSEASGVECRVFPPGFPLAAGGMCLHRGGGVGALCAKCPLSPRGAGVGVRVWRRSSASGYLVGCGETPHGENIPGVPPAFPGSICCCFLKPRGCPGGESWGEGVSWFVSDGSFAF